MSVPFQLDTNLLIHYVRADAVWDDVRLQYRLFVVEPIPQFSVVTLGEIRSFAKRVGWIGRKLERLEFALGYFRCATIDANATVEAYADIDSDCQSRGFTLGKNDLWIAATAFATGATLISTDRDYDRINPGLLSWLWIDPSILGRPPGSP